MTYRKKNSTLIPAEIYGFMFLLRFFKHECTEHLNMNIKNIKPMKKTC